MSDGKSISVYHTNDLAIYHHISIYQDFVTCLSILILGQIVRRFQTSQKGARWDALISRTIPGAKEPLIKRKKGRPLRQRCWPSRLFCSGFMQALSPRFQSHPSTFAGANMQIRSFDGLIAGLYKEYECRKEWKKPKISCKAHDNPCDSKNKSQQQIWFPRFVKRGVAHGIFSSRKNDRVGGSLVLYLCSIHHVQGKSKFRTTLTFR